MSDEAWIHDLAAGHIVEDLAYWTGLLEELRPRRVLELGCHTGRISFPLVTTGLSLRSDFQLLGIEHSAVMLDRARARQLSSYPATASALRFLQGAVTVFSLRDKFDLIVFPANGLESVLEIEEQRSCLQSIRRHLLLGGILAVDLRVPCLSRLADAKRGVAPVVRQELDLFGPAPGVARFTSFSKTSSYDADTQTENTTRSLEIYYSDGRHQSLVDETSKHRFFPSELRHLFLSSGFVPVAEYGSYDRNPFSATSSNYLWVMTAA